VDKITAMQNTQLSQKISEVFHADSTVLDAISKTDRAAFVPAGLKQHAYKLDALPIGASQWISSPLTVAKMSHYLKCKGADRVLEVGCGSGYQAAILSHLFRGVFTIERIESLAIDAKRRFKQESLHNIHVRTDDGQRGWIQHAPYDRIIFSATSTHIPDAIKKQLSEGGILLAPMLINDSEMIVRFTKRSGRLVEEILESCEFVPIVNGTQK